MEVLIQSFYCLSQHRVSTVIHCLTKLQQWYYFRVDQVGSAKLKYKWYNSFHDKMLKASLSCDNSVANLSI